MGLFPIQAVGGLLLFAFRTLLIALLAFALALVLLVPAIAATLLALTLSRLVPVALTLSLRLPVRTVLLIALVLVVILVRHGKLLQPGEMPSVDGACAAARVVSVLETYGRTHLDERPGALFRCGVRSMKIPLTIDQPGDSGDKTVVTTVRLKPATKRSPTIRATHPQ